MTAAAKQILSNDLHALSIAEACELIRRKALSPVELTQALLDRAAQLDPKINAYILATPDLALQQARQAEREIMAGNHRGAMHGIPYGAKDVFATAGIATTGHSKAYADVVPATDATAVARLARAGAVLLGKLSTHECAHGGPSFDLPWPPARNPWDLARFSGGSSSGSAAGIAAGLMPAALGTDTGGSIRIPAALCGTVGLKPTYGLVSRHGVMPNSFTYDHAGPLTWTVEDCAIVLQAIAGHDEMDPASASRPVPDYRAALTGDIRGLRIGVLRHLHETDVPLPPVCRAALEQAYGVLRSLGAVLEDAAIRPAQDYYDVKITIAESEIYAVHEHKLRARASDFGEDFLGRTLAAVMIRASDYVAGATRAPHHAGGDGAALCQVRRADRRRPWSGCPARCLAHDRLLAKAQSDDAVQRHRRAGLDAVHRVQPRGAAAVHADRRQALRRGDRAARRRCLRACNILARPAAAARRVDGRAARCRLFPSPPRRTSPRRVATRLPPSAGVRGSS